MEEGQLPLWKQVEGVACFSHLKCFSCSPEHVQVTEKYKLGNPKSFHYLNQTNCYELVGVNEASEYLATRRAMDVVGMSAQDQVLFLGQKDNLMDYYFLS
jgi:Myosin head (motor domain)